MTSSMRDPEMPGINRVPRLERQVIPAPVHRDRQAIAESGNAFTPAAHMIVRVSWCRVLHYPLG